MTRSTDPRPQQLGTVLGLLERAKRNAHTAASNLYKLLPKRDLFDGHRRTYQPLQEDETGQAEVVPPEYRRVQVNGEQLLRDVAGAWSRFYDLQLTMDTADTTAFADLIVQTATGPVTLIERVPVTTLLFLEKRLEDLRTFVSKLPIHDPSIDWAPGSEAGVYQAEPTTTVRTKKVRQHKVTVQPTEHQPAQVDIWNDDVPVGTWTQVRYTSALPPNRYAELMQRVDALLDGVRRAREQANRVLAEDRYGAEALFRFVLDGTV